MNGSSRTNRFRPTLQILEGRDVPAATLDLTATGTSGELNEALFRQVNAQPTGTGVISSFVRVQGTGVERGYNTAARPLQFNENSSPRFTRALQLNDVPVVLIDGVAYRQFLLDINQNSSSPLLSLDELKIYLGDRGNLTGYDEASGKLAGLDAVYNMDANGDNAIRMNYSLNHGSGSGDVSVAIPDRLFAASTANPYVYLYSTFGQTASANAGFEEWAVMPKSDVSGLGSLAGKVYYDANFNGLFDTGDSGLSGVFITLTGVDDRGSQVSLTTVTDANGNYQFSQLRPGTYTLTETQPIGYDDGLESLGTLGGDVGQDFFANIQLKANQIGFGYNFGEFKQA